MLMMLLVVGCGKKKVDEEPKMDINKEVVVVFKDEKFEELIREQIGKAEGEVTSFDMQEIYDLQIKETGIEDLTGLEYATNLSDLSIFKEEIESLDPIKNLNSLKRITISYSVIKKLPIEFGKDVQLVSLSIIDTIVESIDFVSEMTFLETITISDAGVSDISALTKASKLISIYARGNEIVDISALAGKDQLEVINFQGNLIDNISSLEGLKKLYDVNLSYNPVINLKALETLPALEEVTVYKLHDETKFLILDQVDKLIEMGITVYHHR